LRQSGLRVGVVENRARPGGTCALRGCQAKKWFYEGAEAVARSRDLSGIGIKKGAEASWRALRDAKNQFTRGVPESTVEGFKEAGIDFISGQPHFRDDQSIVVGGDHFSARFFVVATGAMPMPLSIDGAHHMITSEAFLELDQLPRRIAFVGGGFISFEFAHFAARLGPPGVHCTILEAGPHPLGPFDRQMVNLLTAASAQAGIDVHCNVTVSAIERQDHVFRIKLGNDQYVACDMVVHGAGRAAVVDDLDLGRANVDYSQKGITVDRKMATSNPRVYAAGDCVDSVQLARVADAEAHIAAANILHAASQGREASMDYSSVPAVLFTYPQYGMVGATEEKLKEDGVAYKKSFSKQLSWPTYKRVGMRDAAYKILVGEADGRLLGAHVLSDSSTGLISSFALAMKNAIPVDVLHQQAILTPYPSRESDILYMLKPLTAYSSE
jgi:glutathione reductase (NADPH)